MFSCFAVQISWFQSDRNKKHKQVRRILGGAALTRPTAIAVSSAETKEEIKYFVLSLKSSTNLIILDCNLLFFR